MTDNNIFRRIAEIYGIDSLISKIFLLFWSAIFLRNLRRLRTTSQNKINKNATMLSFFFGMSFFFHTQ